MYLSQTKINQFALLRAYIRTYVENDSRYEYIGTYFIFTESWDSNIVMENKIIMEQNYDVLWHITIIIM